jgi:hypothetical protein
MTDTWSPTPQAFIPHPAAILALLQRSADDPAIGYITPADLAEAFQAFLSADYWQARPWHLHRRWDQGQVNNGNTQNVGALLPPITADGTVFLTLSRVVGFAGVPIADLTAFLSVPAIDVQGSPIRAIANEGTIGPEEWRPLNTLHVAARVYAGQVPQINIQYWFDPPTALPYADGAIAAHFVPGAYAP